MMSISESSKIKRVVNDDFGRYFANADIPGPVKGSFSYIDHTGYVQRGSAECFVPAMGETSNGVVSECTVQMKDAINCRALGNDVNNQMFGHWAPSDVKLTGYKNGHVLAGDNDFTAANWQIVRFIECEKNANQDVHLFFIGNLAENVINSVYACNSDNISLSHCDKPILSCK